MGEVVLVGLLYGAILSGLLMVVMTISMVVNPAIWVGDYPPDIKEKYGPPDARTQRQKRIVAIPFFTILFGMVALTVLRIAQTSGGMPGFLPLWVGIFTLVMTFNLVDWLLIDWLLFVTLRPAIIVLPGTEGMAGYRDYGFHFRGFLKGTAGSVVASAAIAGIAALAIMLLG